MNRRDTIIIAVLINTGLLAALFMMAIHTEGPEAVISRDAMAELVEPVSNYSNRITEQSREDTQVASRDEIDEVLKNYSLTNSRPTVINPEPQRESFNPNDKISTAAKNVPQEEYVQVKVKKGDFLEKIARANGTTVHAIMQANQMPNERIDVGQVLLIPVTKKKDVSEKPRQNNPTASASSNEPQYYTIKSGDNPWKIAKQFHVRFDELLSLNSLDEGKARNLKPGDVLRVR